MNHTCPHCHAINEAATCLDGVASAPRPGDAGLCFTCCEWFIFDKGGPRKPNEAEAAEFAADPRISKIQKVARNFADSRKRGAMVLGRSAQTRTAQ